MFFLVAGEQLIDSKPLFTAWKLENFGVFLLFAIFKKKFKAIFFYILASSMMVPIQAYSYS